MISNSTVTQASYTEEPSAIKAQTPLLFPSLDSDQEKFAFLIWAKNKIPALFSDGAIYNVDLLSILDDQDKLLKKLKVIPGHEAALKKRDFLNITITPPKEGIRANEVQLKPGVVAAWKNNLKNRFDTWHRNHSHSSIMDSLRRDLMSFNEPKKRKGNEATRLIATFLRHKELRAQYKDPGINELLPRLVHIHSILEENSDLKAQFQKKDLESLKRLLSQGQEQGKNLKQKDLLELYLALTYIKDRTDDPIKGLRYQDHLDQLDEDALRLFNDKNDFLLPQIQKFFEKKDSSLNLVEKLVNERVFFIYGNESNLKGYVSTTVVDLNGQKALYVITIGGHKVTAGDTKLILMGLEKEKSKIGVDHILLPRKSKLIGLINFPAPRGVYSQYTKGRIGHSFSYQNVDVRETIEEFSSDYNTARYDQIISNKEAVILSIDEKEMNRIIR